MDQTHAENLLHSAILVSEAVPMMPATIIPFCIAFVICHFCILRKIKTQGRNIKQLVDASDRNGKLLKQIFEREKKTAKMVFTVVAAFVICWLPLAVVSLCFLGGVFINISVPNLVFVLAFTNSLVNPLLYFGFKKSLGKKLKGLLAPLFSMKQEVAAPTPETQSEKSTSGMSSSVPLLPISNYNNNNNQTVGNASPVNCNSNNENSNIAV